MKTQIKIVVPTDFSVTARNAFQFAENLAESTKAALTVVHVNEYFIPISNFAVAPLSLNEEPQLGEAMENFIQDKNEDTGMPTLTKNAVKTRILKGNTTDRLVELSEEKDTDWIVMGTTGLQDFTTKIIGSTSYSLANKAHCPVFLVPRDAKWRPIRKILFASNSVSARPEMMRKIIAFAEIFKASIHFVHVNEGNHETAQVNNVIWDEFLCRTTPTVSFQTHVINSNNAVQALHLYAKNHNIDLVAFISPHRSFWQNLIHISVTERFAMVDERPMLIMHFDDGENK